MADVEKRPLEDGDERASKLAKVDASTMEGLDKIQSELRDLDRKCQDEQVEVQCKYDKLKTKHFDHRADLLKKIPDFWKQVLLNYGNYHDQELIHEKEMEVLDYIEDIKLEDNLDTRGSHRFTFLFKENPFFSERELVKDVKVGAEDETETKCTPITFKKNPLEEHTDDIDAGESLLAWLQSTDEECEGFFGTVFREHIWEQALNLFTEVGVTEEEGDEDEEGDDDEDEEEGDEEEEDE